MTVDFDTALCNMLTAAPLATCVLAAIGLATVVACLWASVKPIFTFLTGSNTAIIFSLATVLLIVGCASWGYAQNAEVGAYQGAGVSAAILGGLHLAIQIFRHILKWNYNELEDGGL